jgi:hypothetical protein
MSLRRERPDPTGGTLFLAGVGPSWPSPHQQVLLWRARNRPDNRSSAPAFRYDCDDAAGADEHSLDLADALLEICEEYFFFL